MIGKSFCMTSPFTELYETAQYFMPGMLRHIHKPNSAIVKELYRSSSIHKLLQDDIEL